LLSWEALAHWICLKGSRQKYGLIINTNHYSIKDVIKLINILSIRHRLACTLQINKYNKYSIYIRQRSMPFLRQNISLFINYSPAMFNELYKKNMWDLHIT
jgi:hypothetical protein